MRVLELCAWFALAFRPPARLCPASASAAASAAAAAEAPQPRSPAARGCAEGEGRSIEWISLTKANPCVPRFAIIPVLYALAVCVAFCYSLF